MSTLAQHRAALKALLLTVPDVGVVHDIEPYARSESEFRGCYLFTPAGGTAHVRGWFIRRTGTREAELNLQTVLETHAWQITGLMALDYQAASEATFDGLLEAIRQAYRANPTLGGVNALGPANGFGMHVAQSGPAVFAGLLCHRAVLQVQTHAYLSPGE